MPYRKGHDFAAQLLRKAAGACDDDHATTYKRDIAHALLYLDNFILEGADSLSGQIQDLKKTVSALQAPPRTPR
jgi:hypothetical protein